MMTPAVDDATLFAKYLDVLNWSFQTHREQILVQQRLELARMAIEGQSVAAMIRHRDGTPATQLAVCFQDGRLHPSPVRADDPSYTWRLNREHLERVVRSPEEFVHHPEHLDWGWVQVEQGSY